MGVHLKADPVDPLLISPIYIGSPHYGKPPMSTDRWPQPPFHPKDYPALLELLGPEEFERRVCPLDVARKRWRRWQGGQQVLVRTLTAGRWYVEALDEREDSSCGHVGNVLHGIRGWE